MKLLTWNCNGALRRKFKALEQFDADIMVIQECEDPAENKDEEYRTWAKNFFWCGDNKNKGLGVFAKPGIELLRHPWDDGGTKHFIPVRINNSFDIIAVWAHQGSTGAYQYIGQFWKYFQLNKDRLSECIIIGDFNSNKIWDKPKRIWNHSCVVRELNEIGIRSIYHEMTGDLQGAESVPTFYLQKNLGKPYHIDYIFACSTRFPNVREFHVGNPQDWLGVSDHVPLVVTL
ncbi:MAG: endonuclease/exonuclease/phosphatase family protein [Taibaiella sp.]|nr:endonuclease/exonuclease/phosphatase family protein [Taibaiella sp.]